MPGIVWLRCEGKFSVSPKPDHVERALSYLLYSLFSYFVCYTLIGNWIDAELANGSFSASLAMFAGVILFITGILGGVVTGFLRERDLIGRVCSSIGVMTVHPTESAWTKAFSRRHGCLVRVTFKNGDDRYGQFGTKSLASTSRDLEDIYLETTFVEDENGELVKELGGCGFWVPRDEISCVRFYSLEVLDSDNARSFFKREPFGLGGSSPDPDTHSSPQPRSDADRPSAIGGEGGRSITEPTTSPSTDCEPKQQGTLTGSQQPGLDLVVGP